MIECWAGDGSNPDALIGLSNQNNRIVIFRFPCPDYSQSDHGGKCEIKAHGLLRGLAAQYKRCIHLILPYTPLGIKLYRRYLLIHVVAIADYHCKIHNQIQKVRQGMLADGRFHRRTFAVRMTMEVVSLTNCLWVCMLLLTMTYTSISFVPKQGDLR